MSRTVSLWLLTLLAVIGLIDALYLSYSAYTATSLVCDIEGLTDCNVVAQSAYSRLWGIPLAYLGAAFYVAILVVTLALWRMPSRLMAQALIGFTALGALASAYFLYLQLMVIEAFCIYCLVSAATSFLLLALAVYAFQKLRPCPPAVVP